jgi:DNA-binding transcriptional ArsR family regulator
VAKSNAAKRAADAPLTTAMPRATADTMAVIRGLGAGSEDRLIHDRLRLAIVSALAVNDNLSFSELKQVLDTTDGNLSVHARKLEEGGYISCHKSFQGRKPLTQYRLTDPGRRALERYLSHMESLVQAMRSA